MFLSIAKIAIALFSALVMKQVFASANDWITCKRDKPNTRQFCSFKEQSQEVHTTVAVPKFENISAPEVSEVLAVIDQGYIEIEKAPEAGEKLYLLGLDPHLKLQVEWDDSPECIRNPLWTSSNLYTAIQVGEIKKITDRNRIRPGLVDYNINLRVLQSEDFAPWRSELVDRNIEFTTFFSLFDRDYDPETKLHPQRIPKSCKLKISNFSIGFEPVQLAVDVGTLKSAAILTEYSLAKSLQVHALTIAKKNQKMCSVLQLARTLQRVNYHHHDESWGALPLRHRAIVAELVEKVVASPSSDSSQDYWEVFVAESFQQQLQAECSEESFPQMPIATSTFEDSEGRITDQEGYNNAMDFLRAKRNMKQIRVAAMAIKAAAEHETSVALDVEWQEFSLSEVATSEED